MKDHALTKYYRLGVKLGVRWQLHASPLTNYGEMHFHFEVILIYGVCGNHYSMFWEQSEVCA